MNKVCYFCHKSNPTLLQCAFCSLITHPDCFLKDFERADVTEKPNWICQICHITEANSILTVGLKETSFFSEVRYEVNSTIKFNMHREEPPDVDEGSAEKIRKSFNKVFIIIGEDILSYAASFDLTDIFGEEDVADEKTTCKVVTQSYRNDDATDESLGYYAVTTEVYNLEESSDESSESDEENNDGCDEQWLVKRVPGDLLIDLIPDYQVIQGCIEVSENFLTDGKTEFHVSNLRNHSSLPHIDISTSEGLPVKRRGLDISEPTVPNAADSTVNETSHGEESTATIADSKENDDAFKCIRRGTKRELEEDVKLENFYDNVFDGNFGHGTPTDSQLTQTAENVVDRRPTITEAALTDEIKRVSFFKKKLSCSYITNF